MQKPIISEEMFSQFNFYFEVKNQIKNIFILKTINKSQKTINLFKKTINFIKKTINLIQKNKKFNQKNQKI
jgi:hypothetical protein